MHAIRLVNIEEAEAVFKIYRGCAKFHADKGFFQWDENYPSMEIIISDIRQKQLYGIYDKEKCLGIISLNHDEPKEYTQLTWEDKSSNYIIIHRLCIDIEQMKKGFAKKLMSFSETWAKEQGFSSIRLDTYSPNTGAVRFYTDLNYIPKGEVYFEKRKEFGYSCFEKIL